MKQSTKEGELINNKSNEVSLSMLEVIIEYLVVTIIITTT